MSGAWPAVHMGHSQGVFSLVIHWACSLLLDFLPNMVEVPHPVLNVMLIYPMHSTTTLFDHVLSCTKKSVNFQDSPLVCHQQDCKQRCHLCIQILLILFNPLAIFFLLLLPYYNFSCVYLCSPKGYLMNFVWRNILWLAWHRRTHIQIYIAHSCCTTRWACFCLPDKFANFHYSACWYSLAV